MTSTIHKERCDMSLFDLFILLFLFFGLIRGWSQGLFHSLARVIAFLGALAVGSHLAAPVGEALGRWIHLDTYVKNMLAARIPAGLGHTRATPEELRPLLEQAHIPPAFRDQMLANLAQHNLLDAMAAPYIKLLSTWLGLIIVTTFFYPLITLMLATPVRIMKSAFPRFLDALGGLGLGLILTLFELAFLALFLTFLADLPTLSADLQSSIRHSELLPPLHDLARNMLDRLGRRDWLPIGF
jgi:uncharacterized membrane protein required for colicin V production